MPRLLEPCNQRKAGGDFGPHRHFGGPPVLSDQIRVQEIRSKVTATRRTSGFPLGSHEVIHISALAQRILLVQRVVMQANDFIVLQPCLTRIASKLGRANETRVVMRTFGQQVEYVLSANYRKQIRLGIAINR